MAVRLTEPTEAEYQDRIVELARTFGWRAAHFRPARTVHGWRTPGQYDAAGFVDLTLAHPERKMVVAAEIKSRRGRVTDEQQAWLDTLDGCQVTSRLWRPADWAEVVEILSDGRAR